MDNGSNEPVPTKKFKHTEPTINITDEEPTLNLLKFDDPKIDCNKYTIKHPINYTIGCNLLIKIEENEENDAPVTTVDDIDKTWLIPVHKKFVSAEIPYFKAMFKQESSWRENKLIGSTESVSVPDHFDQNTVLKYITLKYISYDPNLDTNKHETDPKSDSKSTQRLSKSVITTKNCVELFDLAVFWCDDQIQTSLIKFMDNIDNNSFQDIFSKIYDHPRLHSILKPVIMKYISRLQVTKNEMETQQELKRKQTQAFREFYWFSTVNNGLRVYSGSNSDFGGGLPIYKIRAVTSIRKLMNAYCQQSQDFPIIEQCQFKLGNRVLVGSDTAEYLALQDGDIIKIERVVHSLHHLE